MAFPLFLAFNFYAAPLFAAGAEIRNPQLIATEGNTYALSVDLRIDINLRMEEAVVRGVPLYFVMEFELERPRWYWKDEKVLSKSRTWQLSYHHLTRQYRLSSGSLHLSFPTLEEALGMLSHVHRWQVVDMPLKAGIPYTAGVHFFLDISQLPRPFQLSGFLNRDWNMDSGWLHWKFSPADFPETLPEQDAGTPPPQEVK